MSKNFKIERDNKQQYIEKFCNTSFGKSWPPKPEHFENVLPYITKSITDLIIQEACYLLAEKVVEGQKVNSRTVQDVILKSVGEFFKENDKPLDSAEKEYERASDAAFEALEQAELIGGEDTCNWTFVE